MSDDDLGYWRNRTDVIMENPPWCHRQGIPGTGSESKERACIRCRFRESCGEVD